MHVYCARRHRVLSACMRSISQAALSVRCKVVSRARAGEVGHSIAAGLRCGCLKVRVVEVRVWPGVAEHVFDVEGTLLIRHDGDCELLCLYFFFETAMQGAIVLDRKPRANKRKGVYTAKRDSDRHVMQSKNAARPGLVKV